MWEYRARAVDVHDGDSLTLLIDLGFRVTATQPIRLLAVFAPELSQPGGLACREHLLTLTAGEGWPLVVSTSRTRTGDAMSFARYIGQVHTANGLDVNQAMRGFITAGGWPGGIGSKEVPS